MSKPLTASPPEPESVEKLTGDGCSRMHCEPSDETHTLTCPNRFQGGICLGAEPCYAHDSRHMCPLECDACGVVSEDIDKDGLCENCRAYDDFFENCREHDDD